MKRILICCLLVLLSTFVRPIEAAVFERDWKTPGDGLLTYDDVNQREWLDLSQSRLSQFPEPRLPNAVAQIAPGGLFQGFSWGRSADVLGLAVSAGIDTTTWDYATNQAAASDLINLLGTTFNNPPFVRSLAFIDPTDFTVPAPSQAGTNFFVSFNQTTGQGGIAGLLISSNDDFFKPTYNPNTVGVMLFRAVPEPGASSIVFICACAISICTLRWER